MQAGGTTLRSHFPVLPPNLLGQAAWKSLKSVAHLLAACLRASSTAADDRPLSSQSVIYYGGSAMPSFERHHSCRHQKFGPRRQHWRDVNIAE